MLQFRNKFHFWWWVSPALWRPASSGLVLLVAATQSVPQEDPTWRLRTEDADLPARVYLRDRPGAAPAFRATTVIDARLSALATVLLDASRTQDWVYRVRHAELLQSEGPNRGITLVITGMPFPLADRESVVSWEMTQDPQTLVVSLKGQQAPHAPPSHPARVRMPVFESLWTLAPRSDGRVDVMFEGMADLGGNLDGPVLRHFVSAAVWQGPWNTVLALHRMVRLPEYAQATLGFIREPAL